VKTEFEKAKSFAYRLLAFRWHTRKELASRLVQKGFTPEVSGRVLDMLEKYGYINDRLFACRWVEHRLAKRGFRGLKKELLEKGVSGVIVDEVLDELGCDAEYDAALELAKRKLAGDDEVYPYPRLAGTLKRRGFSSEVIRKVCRAMRDGKLSGF